MVNQEYKEISPEMLELARGNTWSIESMEGHEAEDRTVEYVGSVRQGKYIRDYYRDNAGGWWYQNRIIENGRIVSMETYLFGREITKVRKARWKN